MDTRLHEDFGDEPSVEERMDPFYTDEGIALLEEFREETLSPSTVWFTLPDGCTHSHVEPA